MGDRRAAEAQQEREQEIAVSRDLLDPGRIASHGMVVVAVVLVVPGVAGVVVALRFPMSRSMYRILKVKICEGMLRCLFAKHTINKTF